MQLCQLVSVCTPHSGPESRCRGCPGGTGALTHKGMFTDVPSAQGTDPEATSKSREMVWLKRVADEKVWGGLQGKGNIQVTAFSAKSHTPALIYVNLRDAQQSLDLIPW